MPGHRPLLFDVGLRTLRRVGPNDTVYIDAANVILNFENLPTADPLVAGQLWRKQDAEDNWVIIISSGVTPGSGYAEVEGVIELSVTAERDSLASFSAETIIEFVPVSFSELGSYFDLHQVLEMELVGEAGPVGYAELESVLELVPVGLSAQESHFELENIVEFSPQGASESLGFVELENLVELVVVGDAAQDSHFDLAGIVELIVAGVTENEGFAEHEQVLELVPVGDSSAPSFAEFENVLELVVVGEEPEDPTLVRSEDEFETDGALMVVDGVDTRFIEEGELTINDLENILEDFEDRLEALEG